MCLMLAICQLHIEAALSRISFNCYQFWQLKLLTRCTTPAILLPSISFDGCAIIKETAYYIQIRSYILPVQGF